MSPLILQTKNIKVQTIDIDTDLGNTKNYGRKSIKNPDSLLDKTSIVTKGQRDVPSRGNPR